MNIKSLIRGLLIIVFLSLFIYSLYHIVEWMNNNKANKVVNEHLHKYIKTDDGGKYKINFDKLSAINNDTVAYIKVNNTNIDYVVVKGIDNDYYLSHNFEKKNNKSGWIFMDYKNNLDGQDKNIIIYGHNTADRSMFGSLRDVLTKNWQEDINNHTIILVTSDGINKYQVFSTYKVDNEDYYIQTDFVSDESYVNFLNKIQKRSVYNYNVVLNKEDQILTLSTCSNQGKKRVVLHAKLIK